MKKIIHPRLAAGISGIAYLLLFIILEKITNYQFISTHIIILCVVFLPIGIIIYNKFNSTYNRKNNDDKLFMIIGIILFSIFLVLYFLF